MNAQPNPVPELPEPPASNSQSGPTATHYRPKGKIASLPKEQRDLINQMLLDGHTYVEVCQKMSQLGVLLNVENVSKWHAGGYQDFLWHQHLREDTQALSESATDLMGDSDPTTLNQAILRVGTLEIFAALRQLHRAALHPLSPAMTYSTASPILSSAPAEPQPADPPTAPEIANQNSKIKNHRSILDLALGGDSMAFVRLINALARASRETLLIQKYRDAIAQARAALKPLLDAKRKLTQSETRAIVMKVNELMGLVGEADESDHNSGPEAPANGSPDPNSPPPPPKDAPPPTAA